MPSAESHPGSVGRQGPRLRPGLAVTETARCSIENRWPSPQHVATEADIRFWRFVQLPLNATYRNSTGLADSPLQVSKALLCLFV